MGFRVKGSISEQIDALNVGETIAKASRIAPEEYPFSDIEATYEGMTSTLTAAMYRHRRDHGESRQFKTERGRFSTNDNSIVLVVILTRIA